MSSTVTTATISTITTVSMFASLSLIAIITLSILLIKKEVISTSESPWLRGVSRSLNIAIIPLGLIFVVTVIFNLAELFN